METEESHASDRFILSSDELPPEIQPAADMRLKVTYDGSVLETDPAQFSGIEKIEMMLAVVQEETDAPVPASASGGDIRIQAALTGCLFVPHCTAAPHDPDRCISA